jgi:Ribbon-helix-helix protein, copG family
MKRMQLNLDDDLWNTLHARARSQGTTISALLRQAARERYRGNLQSRREAMLAFVGIRRDNSNTPDSAEYVRRLRRGS